MHASIGWCLFINIQIEINIAVQWHPNVFCIFHWMWYQVVFNWIYNMLITLYIIKSLKNKSSVCREPNLSSEVLVKAEVTKQLTEREALKMHVYLMNCLRASLTTGSLSTISVWLLRASSGNSSSSSSSTNETEKPSGVKVRKT